MRLLLGKLLRAVTCRLFGRRKIEITRYDGSIRIVGWELIDDDLASLDSDKLRQMAQDRSRRLMNKIETEIMLGAREDIQDARFFNGSALRG